MTTQPAHRLQRSNWLPTLTAVAVLLVCLFYTFALAYLAPYPGITLNTGWVVTWIDPCDPSSTGCQANQNLVQVGDQVLRIGKLDYEKYRHDRRLVPFGGYRPGESVSIVLNRGGRSQTIGWQMPKVTAVERIKRTGSPILYLPFWLAGTILILFLRPRDRRWRLLVAFNYVTAIWLAIGLVSAWNVAASSLFLHAVTWLVMPIYLHLHLLVPTPLLGKRFRYLVPSLYVIGTILAALELDQLLPRNLYALGLLLAISGSLGMLVWRLFAPSSLSARLPTRLILVGIGQAFGPAAVLALIPNLLGSSAPGGLAINISLLAIPVLPFFYIYAVYKYRLGALEFRANRLLSTYLFALLYITVVALVSLLGWQLMLTHDGFIVLFLAVSTVLVLTAPVLRPHFQRLVDRLIYGTTYNPDEILRAFASQIPSALERKALASLLADRMMPSLLIRQSALYLLAPEGANLVYAQGVSPRETPEATRQVRTFLASANHYLPDPAQAGSRSGYVSEQEFDWVRLAVPLEARKRMVGIWLFGRRDPDDYYSQQDIVLLTALAGQVAVAVENAQLYESVQQELKERRRAVEALQQSEARYRAIVEDQTELISRFLPDGTITFVNAAYCRHFGKRREEPIGRSFMTAILSQDRGVIEGHLASLSRENPAATIEARAVMPSGKICWLVWTLRAIFDKQDRLIEFQGVGRDITEHKRAEEKLYKAEARYHTLVEQIPAITYIAALDEASTTLFVSPQIETILGFSPADYRANPDVWREQLHPGDRERMLAEVACCHATGKPLISDYRMLTRDGRIVWFHDEATLVRDLDGQPLFLQGVMLDITERKRIEMTLQESELRYRSLVETSPDAIALIDLDFRCLMCNQQDAMLHGYESTEEMIGRNVLDLVAPEDRPRARGYISSDLKPGSIRNLELTLLKKDGTRFAAEISASTITKVDGQPQSFMTVVRDITERKQMEEALHASEKRFRALVENSSDYIAMIDSNGTILYASPSIKRILGYSVEELVGRNAFDLIHPDDLVATTAVLRALLQKPGSMSKVEYRLLHKDGSWRWTEGIGTNLLAEPSVQAIVTNARDITESKRAEEALRASEIKFRGLVEQSSDGIILFDEQGLVLEWNRGQEQIAGLKRDDMIGRPIWDVLHQMASDEGQDPTVHERNKTAFTEFLSTGQAPYLFQLASYDILRPDGGCRTVRTTVFPIQTNSGYMGGATTHDITMQRQIEELLMDHAQEMEALYKTSLEINAQSDVPTLLQAIVQRAAGLIGTQMGGLYLMKPDGETLELVVSHNLPGDYLGVKLHLGEGLAGRVALTGKPMTTEDYLHWEERAAAYANAPLRRVLRVPLKVGDRVIGVIDVVDDETVGPFSEGEIRLVSLFADQAAIAIENARLYQAEREQRELSETMREIGAMLASTLDLHTVLDCLLQQVGRVVPNNAAAIMLVEDDHVRVARLRSSRQSGLHIWHQATLPIADSWYMKQMLATGEPVVVSDTVADPNWVDAPRAEWVRSYAAAPIRVQGEVIGFLNLGSATPGQFGPAHAERLRMFADRAAIAVKNARLYQAEQEQRELAETMREISAVLASSLDMNRVLDRLLANIGRIVPSDVANVMLIEDDQVRITRWHGYDRFGIEAVDTTAYPIANIPNLRQMMETGQPGVVADTQADPHWLPRSEVGWRSYVGAPICVQGRVIGFLNVSSVAPGFFTPAHAQRLRAFADQAAIALENARLFKQAQDTASRLQAVSQQLVETQETERRHIAQELHDEIGQIVTGLKLRLEMSSRLPDDALRDSLGEAEDLVHELLERVRELSLNLRPAMLDDLGLLPALMWLVERCNAQANAGVAFKHNGLEHRRFSPEVETAAYRIVQEALTNVARHASASAVTVRLWATQDTLCVQVEDDGAGFNPEGVSNTSPSSGLSNMRERAALLGGTLEIESSSGAGTRVTAELPLDHLARPL